MDAYGLPQKHENGEFGQGVEMNMSRFDTHDYVSHSNGLEGEGKYNVRQDMSSCWERALDHHQVRRRRRRRRQDPDQAQGQARGSDQQDHPVCWERALYMTRKHNIKCFFENSPGTTALTLSSCCPFVPIAVV